MTKLKQIKAALKNAKEASCNFNRLKFYDNSIDYVSDLLELVEESRRMAGYISVGGHLDTCSYRLLTGHECDCHIEISRQYLYKLKKWGE